jgi:NAD(P)-dependent dehydrogenase (short-subunit alcohol dehydrogenase family)
MDLQLQNKLAVVTGSTGDGIGRAIGQELARYGAFVVVNGRSKASVQPTVAEIVAETNVPEDHVIGVVGDVSSAEGVDAFIQELTKVEEQVGRPVEILINNVGIFGVKDFVDIPDEKWFDYFNINLMSGVRLSRHFLPLMLERNSGRILFVSSECGLRPLPHMVPYSVSKTSQISLARGLAEITKGTKVTVNSILPGPTMTGGVRDYMCDFAKAHGIDNLEEAIKRYFAEHETTSLLQRFLDPREVANVTVFLCSPHASGINGVAQHVDGGIVRHI